MKNFLAGLNRMLLDLIAGCLLYGVIAGIVLAVVCIIWYPTRLISFMIGFVCGILLTVGVVIHMYYGIGITLEYAEEKSATNHSRKMYIIRLFVTILIMALIWTLLGVDSLVIMLLGMMSLKVSAYMQPFTDKYLVSKIIK